MSGSEKFAEWLAALAIAVVTWVSSVLAPVPAEAPATPALANAPGNGGFGLMLEWAQDAAPPIEQVGEGTADVETLDEGAPPPESLPPVPEQATLDVGAVSGTEEDIELLDQGAPPAAQPVTSTTTEVVYVEPVADPAPTYVAPEPVVATGPVLPKGFGSGNVHVATGQAGFPVGLEDCHVGAVTGRAYVGIDCGESGEASFVGHAPSFNDFPFVLEDTFPFDPDAELLQDGFPFADNDEELRVQEEASDNSGGAEFFVSASRNPAPSIEISGNSTVQYPQRARGEEPRERVENRAAKKNKNKNKNKNKGDDTRAAQIKSASGDADTDTEAVDQVAGETKKQRAKRNADDRDPNDRANRDDNDGDRKAKREAKQKAKKQTADRDKKDKKNKKRRAATS
jgi:hypothetical protein